MPYISPLFLESLKKTQDEAMLYPEKPKEKILLRNGYMEASGKDKAAVMNNEAIAYILMQDYDRAILILEEVTGKSPHFYPAFFNLGMLYLARKDHKNAFYNFNMGKKLFPQYWKNYFFMAKCYELAGNYDEAIYHYRLAYLRNPFDLESLTALGDLLVNLNRLREAESVYRYCLKQDRGFNFALSGMGKVSFYRGNFYSSLYWFKAVNLHLDYPREYHFYYAESLFNIRDYTLASSEYEKMLSFPQNPIYEKISLSRMRFRLSQSRRLALQEESQK